MLRAIMACRYTWKSWLQWSRTSQQVCPKLESDSEYNFARLYYLMPKMSTFVFLHGKTRSISFEDARGEEEQNQSEHVLGVILGSWLAAEVTKLGLHRLL